MVNCEATLNGAIKQLPQSLLKFGGGISCFAPRPSDQWHRGSQEPTPLFPYVTDSTNTWRDIGSAVSEAEPALADLREALKNPPTGISYDISAELDGYSFPNLVFLRVSAQTLQTAALLELHNNDLPAAIENLAAVSKCVRLGEDDPSLVSFMVRMAVLQMTIDTLWDALQAEGWTDQQLAWFAQFCEDNGKLLAKLPGTLDAERARHLEDIVWFRSHSYSGAVARDLPILESLGARPEQIDRALSPRLWREWIYHPLWTFAWADQEQLLYLKDQQHESQSLREVLSHRSLQHLEKQIEKDRASYRAPIAGWRFYRKLPLHEDFVMSDWRPLKYDEYPYPSFGRAWDSALEALTLNELARTAIAIKRYSLRNNGRVPSALTELSPALLKQMPTDFMDGNPLRYRLKSDGTFLLYSVGRDFRDDGGNTTLASHNKSSRPWDGKDCVWSH
jgi:hypothetical protein